MTDRELLDALVAALRPLLDPETCSPFITAWELDGHRSDIDGEEIHVQIKALVAQYDYYAVECPEEHRCPRSHCTGNPDCPNSRITPERYPGLFAALADRNDGDVPNPQVDP
jgi:hypothetical protein